jgi:poly(3-hydroxybutyrate) depolymerase
MTLRLVSKALPALALCLLACGGAENGSDPAAGAPNGGTGGAGRGGAGISGSSNTSGGSTAGGGRAGQASGGSAAVGGGAEAGASIGRGGGSTSGGRANDGGAGSSAGGAPAQAGAGQAGAPIGCGAAAATGAQEKTITVDSTERTYVLFVPAGYTPDSRAALVFAWHGLGGSGALARRYFGIESRAGKGAIFVYPDGLATGQDDKTGWELTAKGRDVAFFDAMLAEVSHDYCVDSKRIFSTGHSFGAMMSNALGCFRGDVLRAIAPVAGMPPRGQAAGCTGEVATWIAHGENDATVDFMSGGVATRDFWLGRNGCSTTDSAATMPEPCVAYSGCKADLPVHWCVHQDDHNWPNFAAAGIWAFFSSFQ